MKILRFVLVAGGIVLLVYGVMISLLPQYRSLDEADTNQTIGIFGLALLAIVAGIFMKRRR
ncbi:hypothetical protein C5O00_02190 [Pukyongia salina]|uniref:LPXTG cell wall anchor domain-containing protein n=1 Tax=Pukyongia salina TaxID=2094025 RepID=A0A2S0HTV8_9FLAO|nr:LPXTG cell wall anchor domain-containing protein [Pukyongia salina]AVI50038.1 hypothetical protein C5O00_02190 [Pukyongia salina]